MDHRVALEDQFALPLRERVFAEVHAAVGDEHRFRRVGDADVDIALQGSREEEFRLSGEVFPLALIGLRQREYFRGPRVFPVVVAGLGAVDRDGAEIVLLQDEVAEPLFVEIAPLSGARPDRHQNVVAYLGRSHGREVDRCGRCFRRGVGDRGAMVFCVGVQLIERDVVAIEVQHAAPGSPCDMVGVDLPAVAKHDFRATAGQGDAVERLNVVALVGPLRQNHLAIADFQAARVDALACNGQGAAADLVQVVAGHAVDAPDHGGVFLHVDAAAHPGLIRLRGNDIAVMEGQRAGSLVDGVVQCDFAVICAAFGAEGQVLARVEPFEVERAVAVRVAQAWRLLVAMHQELAALLGQAACAPGAIE